VHLDKTPVEISLHRVVMFVYARIEMLEEVNKNTVS